MRRHEVIGQIAVRGRQRVGGQHHAGRVCFATIGWARSAKLDKRSVTLAVGARSETKSNTALLVGPTRVTDCSAGLARSSSSRATVAR